MQVARRLAAQPGITDASAVLATPANRRVLTDLGYGGDALTAAGPNDLVLAIEGEEKAVDQVAASVDSYFTSPVSSAGELRSIADAVAARPDCNVAVISVPGEHAAREARTALEQGLHVFLFSSNVAVEDELALKKEAHRRGLIVMGPDCGTAFINGAGIGFMNKVRRGPIGIVGSTGTGMQEFASLVHRAGSGISHGIGTGSRDLSDAIGGLSTFMAIDALERDPATKVIVVLAKPAGSAVAAKIEQRLARSAKPTVTCFLGSERGARTIDDAVVLALRAADVKEPEFLHIADGRLRARAALEIEKLSPERRYVRGVFAGGSLCYQAQAIFRETGLSVYSNEPLRGMKRLEDPNASLETSFVDMGAEVFVEGRPHPMIDATLRRKRIEREANDPAVAILLVDFILGSIASRNPAGDLLGAIREIRRKQVCVVASVCGTEEDEQCFEVQKQALEEAGVLVFPSSAQAVKFCREAAFLLAQRKEAAHAGHA